MIRVDCVDIIYDYNLSDTQKCQVLLRVRKRSVAI